MFSLFGKKITPGKTFLLLDVEQGALALPLSA